MSDEQAWAALRAPGGLEAWERSNTALRDYMNDASVDELIGWFERASSEDPEKFRIASIIATTPKPVGVSRILDLPFIRFYLYKTLMNETPEKISESQFNKILTIDNDHFHLRSGVDKTFGGDRTKHCFLILRIEDMLKGIGSKYKISDQAKKCRKQQQYQQPQLQELDNMNADAKYLRLGEDAFGADDDYFILNSAGPADLPLAGPLPPFVARDLKSSDQYRNIATKSEDHRAQELEKKKLADVRASALSDLKSSSRVSFLQGNALSAELKKHMDAGSKKAIKSRKSRKSRKAMKAMKSMKARKLRKANKSRKARKSA